MDITRHDGSRINHAEKKLLVFHYIDVVSRYDCENPPDPMRITEIDIKLANIIGARFGKRYWAGLKNKDISWLPYNVDLLTMPNVAWYRCKQVIQKPTQDLLDSDGVACAVLTKALHRKRPNLIPVCDGCCCKGNLRCSH